MSKPVLYSVEASPPVRAVRIVAKLIGLELEIRDVDLFAGQHLGDEFLKFNPQHTVPTLIDDGEAIWDSHAICTYLISKYANDDSLYSKDLVKRARIDQRLHFDSGVLFPGLRAANIFIFYGGKEVPAEKIAVFHEALKHLESFLTGADYLVGDSLTVADICCLTTATFFEVHTPIDEAQYPNVRRWINHLSTILPNYEELVTKPTAAFKVFLDEFKAKNAAADDNK